MFLFQSLTKLRQEFYELTQSLPRQAEGSWEQAVVEQNLRAIEPVLAPLEAQLAQP